MGRGCFDEVEAARAVEAELAAALDDGEAHDAAGHGGDAGAAKVMDGHAGRRRSPGGLQVMEDEEAGSRRSWRGR